MLISICETLGAYHMQTHKTYMTYRHENLYNHNTIVYISNIKFTCLWNLVTGYLHISEVNTRYLTHEDFLAWE